MSPRSVRRGPTLTVYRKPCTFCVDAGLGGECEFPRSGNGTACRRCKAFRKKCAKGVKGLGGLRASQPEVSSEIRRR